MYYASINAYGSETSSGFANTWSVKAFSTKAERDEYVRAHALRLDVNKITRAEAVRLVGIAHLRGRIQVAKDHLAAQAFRASRSAQEVA